MKSVKSITRRTFLQQGASVAAGAMTAPYFIPASALGQNGTTAPSNRIVVGGIGIGNQGRGDLRNFLGHADVQVVAVCDVNGQNLEKAVNQVNEKYGNTDCKGYGDFRELLGRDDIDAVLIAPPHHWHVPIGVAAAKAGKDMYMEKPMGMAIAWNLEMKKAVKRYGVLFQWGTQQRSDARFHHACKLVHENKLGKITAVKVWGPSGRAESLPNPMATVPDWLDYDMWIGPAPYAPYQAPPDTDHTRPSPGVRSDRSLGNMSEWGAHMLDIPIWAGFHQPQTGLEIEGTGQWSTGGGGEDTPVEYDVIFRYGTGITVEYKSGNIIPAYWKTKYLKEPLAERRWEHGVIFEGTDGWVQVDRFGINAEPQSLLDNITGAPGGRNHVWNFVECCKTRQTPAAPIDTAVEADNLVHLAYIAVNTGQRLNWDNENHHFINNDSANRLVDRPMRSPWCG